MHDLASAAVEAALDAGARYADARVMEMRTDAMGARNGVIESLDRAEEAGTSVWDTRKWLASSEGHRIEQHIVECGAEMSATAVGEAETQRRSYPGIRGQFGTRGWELVRELDLPTNAPRIATEARALLAAPQCPALEATDLILGSEQ